MAVSIEDIKKAIKGILKGADLDNLSTKKVRKELEQKFDTDLTKRKKEIDGLVMQMITENEEEEEEKEQVKEEEKDDNTGSESEEVNGAEHSDSEDEVPKKKAKKSPTKQSDEKKKKKSASRADDSEDPVMSSICDMNDEDLAKKLQEEEEFGSRGRTRGARRPPPPPKKEKKKKVKDTSEKKKSTGFTKPMILSEKLAAVVGANEMPRSGVVKALWDIVKERNLKDPKNGQYMKCDEQLADLFGRKNVRMFSMMKYLSKHITDPEKDELVE